MNPDQAEPMRAEQGEGGDASCGGIVCAGVSAGYGRRGERAAIHGISCRIRPGALTVVCGPNGSGKSTLVKALCGVLSPWAGNISVLGHDAAALTRTERARLVAYLPQERPVPDCTVARLMLYGRFPHTSFPASYSAADKAAARRILAETGLLPLADRNVRELSGGQRQRAYIAMALSQDTPAIVLDEPLAALDIAHQLELVRGLKHLAATGKTVVMVCHDLNLSLTQADSLIVLSGGTRAFAGAPAAAVESGVISRVFGVRVSAFPAPGGGTQYGFSL